jgi:acetyl-CoA C-acetyltransferase
MANERIAMLAPTRTAIGRFGGSLKDIGALDLGAHAVKAAIQRASLRPDAIERVVAGENIQLTRGGNPARHVLLRAGIPDSADGYSINMNCSSGLRAMTSLAQDILLGDVEIGVAVGMENMSQTPYFLEGARFGYRLGSGTVLDFLAEYILGDAGPMAENVAAKYGIKREEQDEFAFASQKRAAAAVDCGKFTEEIAPFEVPQRNGATLIFKGDEHLRRDSALEKLAKLPPVFKKDGSVTAGNASGINDGAAAVVLTTESRAQKMGLEPAGYLKSWAASGVEPSLFGIGPVPATHKALKKAGLALHDIKLVELNEAFASSSIAVIRDLELNPEIVNVNGGAIALGHPVGATGLVLITKLLSEMKRRKVQYGLATMCVGSGQGMAVVLER